MKTDPTRAEQDAEILRLRCRGHSLRTIAAEVGLSHQTVANRIEDAIRELVNPRAEEWRAVETIRLDELAHRAYEVLDAAEGESKLKAIDRVLRISESRRKLWALDMPAPLDVTLSRRNDLEGDLVAETLLTALEALEVAGLGDVRERELKAYALALAQWKLLQLGKGDPGPRPEPPRAPVVEAVEPEPDLMADFRQFAEREGFDPDGLDDDEEDDGDGE